MIFLSDKMKTKIMVVIVLTLLIATAIPVIGINKNIINPNSLTLASINRNKFEPQDVPPSWMKGADQHQTENSHYGFVINPQYHIAQEFKPTKSDLTAVALYLFDWDAPSDIAVTVHIRESLDGGDLTTKTLKAKVKDYNRGGNWVMFDFDDITVNPEETYYIICYADGGIVNHSYCWYFDFGNKYDRGIAWESQDSGLSWSDLEDPWNDPLNINVDQCFITYYQEPPKNKVIQFIQSLLEEFISLFPFLEQFLTIVG